MNIKIADLMVKDVITTLPHKSIGHVKDIMKKNKISAVPVINSENVPIGILTSTDFQKDLNESSPVSTILPETIIQVPAYNNIDIAAKLMLKQKIHHVLVTHEKELVGIISSFDLIKLIAQKKVSLKK